MQAFCGLTGRVVCWSCLGPLLRLHAQGGLGFGQAFAAGGGGKRQQAEVALSQGGPVFRHCDEGRVQLGVECGELNE